MTTEQMVQALKDVGACFAVSTAKYVAVDDGFDKPHYHIHPNAEYPHEKHIEHIYSQKQFQDWIRTVKAARRLTDRADAHDLWIAYQDRWAK